MPDALAGLGLPPAPANPDDGGENPTSTVLPVPTPAPPTLATPPEPPEPPVEIPEGAQNPDAVRNLIDKERQNAREANARRREAEQLLREREEAALPLEDRIRAADDRAKEAERRALRLEVGLVHKLPAELVDRLKGESKEEIEADAQSLLSFLRSPAVPTPSADGGFEPPPPAAKPDGFQQHNDWLVSAARGRS